MSTASALPALNDPRPDIMRPWLVLYAVFRHWPGIVVIILTATFGALLYVLLTTPSYTAATKILVTVGREKLLPLEVASARSNNVMFNERPENVNDEIEILRDPTLLLEVYPDLAARLRPGPPIVPTTPWQKFAAEFRSLRASVSEFGKRTLEYVKEPLYLTGLSHRVTPEEALLTQLQNALSVIFIKETDIIQVGFSWSDPQFAAYALNTLIDAYLRKHLQVQSKTGGSVEFYREQLNRTQDDLRAVDAQMNQFLAETGMHPDTDRQMMITSITSLQKELNDTEVDEQQIRQRAAAFRQQYDGSSQWLETPVITQTQLPGLAELDTRYIQLLATRNSLLTQYKPTSRLVKDVDDQITALRAQKLQSLQNYLSDQLATSLRGQQVLTGKLADAREHLGRLEEVDLRYSRLRDRHDQLLKQSNEYQSQIEKLTINQDLNQRDFSSVSVISPAGVPTMPDAPRKLLIIGLAAGFGVMFAAAYVMLAEFLNRTFRDEHDVTRILGLPVVASLALRHDR